MVRIESHSRIFFPHAVRFLTHGADHRLANELIQEDPRNNSAWNQRWFASHRGRKDPIGLELAKQEADFAIHTGATLDPYNESPWRYLVGVLKEQYLIKPNPALLDEYEEKAMSLRTILQEAHRDPDSCSNLTSARIDLFELKGDTGSLEKVSLELFMPATVFVTINSISSSGNYTGRRLSRRARSYPKEILAQSNR